MAQLGKRAWKLQEFPAHAASVNSVSLGHKSGRVLVTGGSDKKVNLWAVGKPNCIMSLSGHSTPVDCVQFSITEEHVCAGSAAGALKIWDLESARILRTLTGHRAGIKCVDFHPYGDLLASGSSDSAIKMWDIRKKGCIFGYKGHSSTVNSLKFSPDGQWIASGGDDNLVKIWDIRKGKVLFEFGYHNAAVSGVEFHPTHFLLASGSMDRTVKVYDLETFSLVSSSLSDVPSVRSILFHPNGSCLFAASAETLRVHGWDPIETYDSVPTSWSKIQDIAISNDQLIGVSTQMTNVSVFVVDLSRVVPIGNRNMREQLNSGHSLRKKYTIGRSKELVESLDAMKVSEESDSLPTDPEDDLGHTEIRIPANFREVFQPHRDLMRTPPPALEDFTGSYDGEPSSHSTDPDTDTKPSLEYKFVSNRHHTRAPKRANREKAIDSSPRRPSVPTINQLQVSNISGSTPSLEYISTSRQSSLSDDGSSGPHSSRSFDGYRGAPPERIATNQPTIKLEPVKSEPRSNPRREGPLANANFAHVTPVFQSMGRSPERPLAQCQVKPMPKIPVPASPQGDECNPFHKTEFAKKNEEYVPIPLDRPSGLNIDEFLPKSFKGFGSGMHMDLNESDVFAALIREHNPFMQVLAARNRNLRIIYNIWQTKDVKTAVETAVDLHDVTVLVDLLGVLVLRPSIWNLDLCVALLPSILQLLQSKYEAHMTAGCSSLRLILKNFASVIKTNIESPIHTVGVDISREERYNKSMECYKHLVDIRTFLLKRQTMQGKIGHSFRELHILLSSLD